MWDEGGFIVGTPFWRTSYAGLGLEDWCSRRNVHARQARERKAAAFSAVVQTI